MSPRQANVACWAVLPCPPVTHMTLYDVRCRSCKAAALKKNWDASHKEAAVIRDVRGHWAKAVKEIRLMLVAYEDLCMRVFGLGIWGISCNKAILFACALELKTEMFTYLSILKRGLVTGWTIIHPLRRISVYVSKK